MDNDDKVKILQESRNTGLPVFPIGENWPINAVIDQFRRLQKMKVLKRSEEEPWIIIKFIGCIPVFGHYNAKSIDFWGINQNLGFRVLISRESYAKLLKSYQVEADWTQLAEKSVNQNARIETEEGLFDAIEKSSLWRVDERVRGLEWDRVVSVYKKNDHLRIYLEALLSGTNMVPISEINLKEVPKNLIDERYQKAFDTVCFNAMGSTLYVLISDISRTLSLQDTLNTLEDSAELVHINATYAPKTIIDELRTDGLIKESINFEIDDEQVSSNGQKLFLCDRYSVENISEKTISKDPRYALSFILRSAIKENASDVHIEEYEGKLSVRYRTNTFLKRKSTFPLSYLPRLNSVISQYGGIDSLKKLVPQSGRFSALIRDIPYEVRVSMIPIKNEQSCVLRIHGAKENVHSIDSINLNLKDVTIFKDALSRKSGIILVTGPTGCGKSTTLYAALAQLNSENISIETIEDPVERHIEGIKQFQVRYSQDESKSLTFPKLFREVLRHDPDVIMVGEIRDLETAKQAITAAQTGHLVLSTLHTQNALGAIPRLISEGVNPQYLADSLLMVQAQRLVGTLCKNCRIPLDINSERGTQILKEFENEAVVFNKAAPVYEAGQCDHCRQTGFEGKHAIFEIFPITEKIRELIAAGENTHRIRKLGTEVGYRTLYQEGLQQVALGQTTFEEVFKYRREGNFDYQELLKMAQAEIRRTM